MFGNTWYRALKTLPKEFVAKDVLIIGMEEPGLRSALERRFRHVEIRTVAPQEITDAKIEVGSVDLVVFHVPGQVLLLDVWQEICAVLASYVDRQAWILTRDDGFQPELPRALYKQFSRQPKERFTAREVTVYRPKGAGTMGDIPPEGYEVYHRCKEHIARECKSAKRFSLVGQGNVWGSRWYYGPFWFEKYYGDEMPTPAKDGPLRLVMWQPIARLDQPKGWYRTRLTNHFKSTGFEELVPGKPYEASWSSHARRYRAKWLKEKAEGKWEVFEPAVGEFLEAYRRAKMDPILKILFIDLVKDKAKTHPEHLRLFAVRRKPGAPIEAGFACVDIPEIKQSKHFVSFICESAKKDPVGVGLMEEWHQYAIKQGFRFLDFGVFWAPGDPKDWRGFSKFKSQFAIWFIRYPYPLVRLMGSPWKIFRNKTSSH